MTQRGAVGCAKTLGNPEMAKDAGAWCSRSPHEVTQGLNNREGTPALSQTLSFPYNCPSVMESPEAPPPQYSISHQIPLVLLQNLSQLCSLFSSPRALVWVLTIIHLNKATSPALSPVSSPVLCMGAPTCHRSASKKHTSNCIAPT